MERERQTTVKPRRVATSRSAMDYPDRQVRPVRLERAHGQDHHGARAVQRLELRRGRLLRTQDGQKLLPRVAAR